MTDESNINTYNKIKRLSAEELENLWHSYFKDKTDKKLRDKIIVQYIYLIKYVLGRIKGSFPSIYTMDDITGYGVEGLIDAIEKYSPDKGARFETYAIMRIRGTIIDKIRSEDWIPRSVRKKMKDVREATETLRKQLGRVPTSTEVGQVLGIEKEKVDTILSYNTTVSSIYEKRGNTDDSTEIIDSIEDTNTTAPLDKLEEKDTKTELQNALKSLPERERTIMVLYYQKNMTLKEIGETIEVSESRVCQIHAQAIMKLKNILVGKRTEKIKKKTL